MEDTANFANASPTCLAAHTKMTRWDSDSPIGDKVFPVPVGAIYKINFGDGFLHRVNNFFDDHIVFHPNI